MRSVGLVAIVGTAALWSAGRAPGQCLHTWTQGLFANEAVSGYVEALAVWDDGSGEALYVGGGFTTAGGQVVNRIARWDGLNWSPLGSGCDNFVSSIVPFDDGSGPALFVGGYFATAGGIASRGIAKWTGSEWVGLGGIGGDLGGVYSLLVHDDGSGPKLYAGGYFM